MNILVIADNIRANEFKQKVASLNNIQTIYIEPNESVTLDLLNHYEVVFDLNFNGNETSIEHYAKIQNRIIVLNAVTNSLHQFYAAIHHSKSFFAGINALPTFINKPKVELSVCETSHQPMIAKLFEKLNWQTEFVGDRVGMITPRVVCMIINEACYTLQEGTASKNDIDLAMKLGTNYPFGPFEWMEKIGVRNVYETLQALYNDTFNERYKICPLLKSWYLETA